jgi:hypothetical protein
MFMGSIVTGPDCAKPDCAGSVRVGPDCTGPDRTCTYICVFIRAAHSQGVKKRPITMHCRFCPERKKATCHILYCFCPEQLLLEGNLPISAAGFK